MAGRPSKTGLDYFELDCQLEDNIKLIQAEFGLKGFAIIVKLYQKIYGSKGYYCEWNEDVLLLFMSENGVSSDNKNLIENVVSACVRRDIFDKKLFDKYQILTSHGIQKRYLNATYKREKVNVKKEYLLISVGKNNKNVVINSISDGTNSINSDGNSQSREEKRKEEKSRVENDHVSMFEEFWSAYPKKTARNLTEHRYVELIEDIEEASLVSSAVNYADYCKKSEIENKYIKSPQNFLGDGVYIDYLPENYRGIEKDGFKKKKTFGNIQERQYDMKQLEKQLLGQIGQKEK